MDVAPSMATLRAINDNAGTHLYAGHDWVEPYRFCGPWDAPEKFEKFNAMTPLPMLPDHLDRRIIAQRGRLTIHTFLSNALEKLMERDIEQYGDSAFLQKLIIPASARSTIRQQCHIFGGVSEDTIFPDLEGLSRGIYWELKEKKLI